MKLRRVADVAELPTVTFGSRSLMWWGTLGYMTIEGWTTALLVIAYIYLRQNVASYPPPGIPNPRLAIPSLNLALMLASTIPATLAANAAKQLDLARVKRWLYATSAITVPIVVLRWWELWAINTRWDSSAYGTGAWLIVGFHTSLLLLDAADTIGLTLFYVVRDMPAKAFSDTVDNTFYWYFTVGLWIPIYLIVYVGPHIA